MNLFKNFFEYLKYKVDKSFQTNILSLIGFLILISIFGIVVFSSLIYILLKLNVLKDISYINNIIWNTFKLFFDQNKILDIDFDKNSFLDLFFKFNITLFGILVFSTLIAIITNFIFEKVMDLRSGRASITDKNHFIIINFTHKTIPLISEIVEGFVKEKKTIVVIDPSDPQETLDTIRRAIKIPKHITILTRKGYGWQNSVLNRINLSEADKIVILNPNLGGDFKNHSDSDIEVAKTLTTIRASSHWRKRYIPIISEFQSEDIAELYNNFATPMHNEEFSRYTNNCSNLTIKNLQSKLIAQCSNTPDASEIYDQLLGFKGSEIYFIDKNDKEYSMICEKSAGKNSSELNLLCKKIIILGFYYTFFEERDDSYPTYFLNPSKDFKFYPGCGIICLAENKTAIIKEFQNLDKIKEEDNIIQLKTSDALRKLNIGIFNLSEEDNQSEIYEILLDLRDIYNQQIEKITLFQKTKKPLDLKKDLLSRVEDRKNRTYGYLYWGRYENNNYHDLNSPYYSLLGLEFVPRPIDLNLNDKKNHSFTLKKIHSESPFFNQLHPGDEVLGLINHKVSNELLNENYFKFDPKKVGLGLLKLLKDRVEDFLEQKNDFHLIVKSALISEPYLVSCSFNRVKEKQLLLHSSLKKEYEESYQHFQVFFDKINVETIPNENLLYSLDQDFYGNYNCKIIVDHQREKFRHHRENPIEDHKIINYFIKAATLVPSEIRGDLSLITEVNGFRTKKLLDNLKRNFFSSLNGNDVIELNTLFSKYIGSVMMNKKSEDLLKLLLEEKMHFLKTHTILEPINSSFTDLEKYMYDREETLIGIIKYETKNLGVHLFNTDFENEDGDIPTEGRKLKEVIINPDQDQTLSLDKWDKLITIANYKSYDQINDRNARLI